MKRYLSIFISALCVIFTAFGCSSVPPESRSAQGLHLKSGSAPSEAEITKRQIMQAYQAQVSKFDGIDFREAKLVAQSEVIFRGYDDQYRVTQPQVKDDRERDVWRVKFFPINRTMYDALHKPNVLVSIEKKDGSIYWELVNE